MRTYHKCIPVSPYSYDEKIPLSEKDTYINKYDLQFKGNVSEYWVHNVRIISDGSNLTFHYVKDISITYDEEQGYLIQDSQIETCPKFSFYKTDIETSYALYEAVLDKYTLHMKDYGLYISFEVISEEEECIFLNKL